MSQNWNGHIPSKKAQKPFHKIYAYIVAYRQNNQYSPVIEEIAAAFDFAKSQVSYWLDQLELQGLLVRRPHTSRGVFLCEAFEDIPVIGELLPSGRGQFVFDPAHFEPGTQFALGVIGEESSDHLHLCPGDYLFLVKQGEEDPHPQNLQLLSGQLSGEETGSFHLIQTGNQEGHKLCPVLEENGSPIRASISHIYRPFPPVPQVRMNNHLRRKGGGQR